MNTKSTSRSLFRYFLSTAVTLVWGMALLTGCGGMDPEGQQGGSLDTVTAQGTLAAPSNVQAFYAEGQWTALFGVTGPYYGPAGHRGLDIAAGAGQGIPALRSGIVRRVQYSSIVGHTIAVESAPGDFSGYDHVIRTRVSVGDYVQQGDIIAYVAGYGDDHGSAWSGPHLHMTRGTTNLCVFGENVSDPAPLIRNVLGTGSGGGTGTGGGSGGIQISIEDGKTLQLVAQRGGYTGPVDGVPGANTWLGVQKILRELGYYDGPVDGVPGVNTYKGLQLLAQDGGYTGPIDGIPGPNTYAGLANLLD